MYAAYISLGKISLDITTLMGISLHCQCPPVCLCIYLTLGLVFTTFHMLELFRLGEDSIEGLKRRCSEKLSPFNTRSLLAMINCKDKAAVTGLKFVCYKNEVVLWLLSEYKQLGQASFDVPLE